MFKSYQTSKLAKIIATHLLAGVGTPVGLTCINTGAQIPGSTNYSKVVTINPSASGAHYLAYGHYYLLCRDRTTEEEYVAVHSASNSKLIGTIERPDEMEVLIREAEVSS